MNIHEVQLLTDDPDQTVLFYRDVLGFKIISADRSLISVSAGKSVLIFHKSDNKKPVYHVAFNIPANRFEEAMNWIGSKRALIEITPSNCVADFITWNAKAFYFYDNNNNIIEMIARYDLDNASEKPFDGSSVCSVSEIGVVVEDPNEFAKELLANYHLQLFPKQKPMDDFIAVGNDDGLFIIVSKNRKWYPTTVRSAKHWAKVTIGLPGRFAEITL